MNKQILNLLNPKYKLLSSTTLITLIIIINHTKEGEWKGPLPFTEENMDINIEYIKNNLNDDLYQILEYFKNNLNEEEYQNILKIDIIKELEKIKTTKSVNRFI